MTLKKALEFIHSVKWQGSKPGLERTRELLQKLGNPEKNLKFIHIAGTNGKGSTAAMLESVLRACGYRTGLYTSPYITRFNERMQALGCEIANDEIARMTEKIRPHADTMKDSPTEFELVTAMAMEFYKEKACDIVVLETGMGGRLDSTNVIESPECVVITAIGLDHVTELGATLEIIAGEKAGIIKPGCDVVLYGQQDSIEDVIRRACDDNNAGLAIADFSRLESFSDSIDGQIFQYADFPELRIPLIGAHQLKNASTALEAIRILRKRGWKIPDESLREGLAATVWPARFEVLSRDPYFIVDGGHNPQCAEAVRDCMLRYFEKKYKIMMIGVMADKDYKSLTGILNGAADEYVTVRPDNPRALAAEKLAAHLRGYGKPVLACGSVAEGVSAAKNLAAGKNGVACAVGSLYMAGEVRGYFK